MLVLDWLTDRCKSAMSTGICIWAVVLGGRTGRAEWRIEGKNGDIHFVGDHDVNVNKVKGKDEKMMAG